MGNTALRKSFVLPSVAAVLVAAGFGLGSFFRPAAIDINSVQSTLEFYNEIMKDDPPLGTKVELPTRDVFGQGLDLAEAHVLVVYEGECTGCSLHPRLQALPFDRFDRVLVVYESHADTVRSMMEDGRSGHHPRLSIVADIEARFISGLNLWPGRWAVVQNGELTRLQLGPDDATF